MKILRILGMLGCIFAGTLHAGPLQVVATGDSLTNGYAPNRLQLQLNALGKSANVSTVASGGANSRIYTGQALDQTKTPPIAHDFAQEVLQKDPDVILFMLGVNDAFYSPFSEYQTNAAAVFDQFEMFVNGRGNHPKVVVASILPVLPHPTNPVYAAANGRIEMQYNPWLESETLARGFQFLDLHSLIQLQPNWQSFYSDNGVDPGYVHLWANGAVGYDWMAGRFALAAVPEPSTLFPGCIALLFLFVRYRNMT